MNQTVDFQTKAPTMRLADSEDRALLGSNPSAAVGDWDIDRSSWLTVAPVPNFFPVVLVRKAINPSFVTTQLWIKLTSLTRPVCHLAISKGASRSQSSPVFYKHFTATRFFRQTPSGGFGIMAFATLLPEGISESPINEAQEFTTLHQPRREEPVSKLARYYRLQPCSSSGLT